MRLKNQIVVLSRQNRAFLMLLCIMLNLCVPLAVAGPEGAQVASGQVTFQQSGLNTTITASDKAIVNYSSFDIAQPEVVRFVQPGSDASVLNRILSANPTNIDGTLLANGRVFFVNPAGVYIGDGAMINVNQLVASGLNISNSDFLNGHYNFVGGEGAVVNRGSILAKKAYLIGERIANSGNIRCPDGYVVMAAGERVFVGESGSNLMIETDVPATARPADPIEGSRILNDGSVEVGGGIMAFVAAGDIYSQAISNVGTLSASVDSGDAGNVKLSAPNGTVVNSGSITAKSRSGRGGTVQLLGDRVGLLGSAEIDASGTTGGGTVLVGGDYKGAGSLPTASRTYVSRNATIKADATQNGDGGKVVVWSDQFTRFLGEICARAGAKGGNGGVVEVSGKEKLGFYGRVDTSAPRGTTGRLLLDPADIVIKGGDGSPPLTDGVAFDDPGDELTVTENAIEEAASHVVLQAKNSITVSGTFDHSTDGEGTGIVRLNNGLDLTMETRNAIGEGSDGIDLTGTDVEFQTQGTGSITLRTGVADKKTGAGVKVGKMTTLGTGSITIESEGGVEIKGPVKAGAGGYYVAAKTGNITFKGAPALDNSLHGSITGAGPGDLRATAGSISNESSRAEKTIQTTNDGSLLLMGGAAANSGEPMTVESAGSLLVDAPLGSDTGSSPTTLRSGRDLTINKSVKSQEIVAHSGISGTGNLAFGPGVTLDAPNITLRAGDGTGGSGTGAHVDPSTAPTISPATYDPFTLKLEQDAGFTDELVKAIFGDKSSLVKLAVTSYDSNLKFTTGGEWKSITAAGYTGIEIGADLQASDMTFEDDVTLGAASTTLTGTTVKFAKKVDGADKSLTVKAGGVTTFGGAVGSAGALLKKVETDAAGSTAINGGSVWATTQTYNDDVTLGAPSTTLTGTTVKFAKKVDGTGKSLTVNAGGVTTFGGPVGSAGALSNLETDADKPGDGPGSTAINGGSVSAATQTYRDDVTLGADTTLTGSDLTFEKSVEGVKGMILNATGKLLANGILWAKAGALMAEAGNDITIVGGAEAAGNMDLNAGANIAIGGDAKAGGTMTQTAGNDITVKGVTQSDGKNLEGISMTLTAKRNITLGETAGGNTDAAGKLTLKANSNGGSTGDLHAYGTVKTTSDEIDASGVNLTFENFVEAATGMVLNATGKLLANSMLKGNAGAVTLSGVGGIELKDNVSGEGLTFNNAVTATKVAAQRFDAKTGKLLAAEIITKTTGGDLPTDGDLTLGGDTGISLQKDVDVQKGSLTLEDNTTVAGGRTLKAGQNVVLTDGKTLTGTGALTVKATGGTATFGGEVTTAGTLDVTGPAIVAKDNISTSAGDLLLHGPTTVSVGKTLTASNNLTVDNGAKLTGLGALTVKAGNDISLGGDTSADGKLLLQAGGTMWAKGKLTTTDTRDTRESDIQIQASDSTIKFGDTVGIDVSAYRDLLLKNNTQVAAGGKLQAGQDVVLADSKTLTGLGALTLDAKRNLTLGGNTSANGALTLSGGAGIELKDDVSGEGLTFNNAVTATKVAAQRFDAKGGTLLAAKTITKTTGGALPSDGDLTLGGDTGISLQKDVDVQKGNLTLEDNTTVAGGRMLKAGQNVVLTDGKTLTGAGALTVKATGGTATFGGEVTTAGTLDVTGPAIVAKDNISTSAGDLLLHGPTTVSVGRTLTASNNLKLGADMPITGEGDLALKAAGGGITAEDGDTDGKVEIRMADDGKTLRLTQKERLLLTTGFKVTDKGGTTPKDTHLVAEVTGGSLEDSTADQWKSITATAENDVKLSGGSNIRAGGALKSNSGGVAVTSAVGALSLLDVTAKNNIELSGKDGVQASGALTSSSGSVKAQSGGAISTVGIEAKNTDRTKISNIELSASGDVVVGGNVKSEGGGVSIISTNGGIYDATTKTTLDKVTIQGYSDQSKGVGVGLPGNENQKAAIRIESSKDLKLGGGLTLTAKGIYDPKNPTKGTGTVDDRGAVNFKLDGDPIDVAIYVASTGPGSVGTPGVQIGSGNITVVNSSGNGALVARSEKSAENASDAVAFTKAFEDSLKSTANTVKHLEVASKPTTTLDWADHYDTLPYAGNAEAFADGKFEYVLRGGAELRVLERTGPAPLAPAPISPPMKETDLPEGVTPLSEEVMDAIRDALGKDFLQIQFLDESGQPKVFDETLAHTVDVKHTLLKLQEYWRALVPDPNKPKEWVNEKKISTLNALVEVLPKAVTENSLALFEHGVKNGPNGVAEWVKTFVEFANVSILELGHNEKSITEGLRDKLLPSPGASGKVRAYLPGYVLKVRTGPTAPVEGQKEPIKGPERVIEGGPAVFTGREMLDYWRVIEDNSAEVISILNKEVESLPDATEGNLEQFEQVLRSNPLAQEWIGAMIAFMSGVHARTGSLKVGLVAQVFAKVLPLDKAVDGRVHKYLVSHVVEKLASRQISVN